MSMENRLHLACEQIEFARAYTLQLIETIDDADWFSMPNDVTHVAWQVGHLAMAQYGLTMIRLRGKEPTDQEFLSNDFFRTFKKGTTPIADANAYPSPAEIRKVLNNVHERSMNELRGYSEDDLNEKLPEPYAVFDTKLGSVLFCSSHELIHAGQIGLLRRELGLAPIR